MYLSHKLKMAESPRRIKLNENKKDLAKNNTKLSFLRQGTQTEEGCFVESAEAILRRPGKKKYIYKVVFSDRSYFSVATRIH